jgi:hypothetical protein
MNARAQKSEASLTVHQLTGLLDELLPLKNKDATEQYGDLLEDLFHFSFAARSKLLRLFKTHRHVILRYEGEMAAHRKILSLKGHPVAAETFKDKLRLARGVYFTHTGLVRLILQAELGELWDRYTASSEWREREKESPESF